MRASSMKQEEVLNSVEIGQSGCRYRVTKERIYLSKN